MPIKLSDHFTYGRLLRFTLPTIVTMVFSSLYSVVDGLFVSNLVGDLALSAVNIVMPIYMILGSVGFMLGSGGSAIVARTMGEGNEKLSNQYFSMFLGCIAVLGAVISVLGAVFIEPLSRLAGASELLLPDCIAYGRIVLGGLVLFMLQTAMQSYFIVAEKPNLGLLFSLGAGITNMVLDYLFIAVLGLGIAGAALATVCGFVVGGVLPVFYFATRRSGLRLTRTRFYPRQFLYACTNGSSELMSNISASLVGVLFNVQLMRLIGESGVAAYAVMLYVDFIFVAISIGFSMGSAPIVSYQYGAGNSAELQSVFRKSMVILAVTSAAMVILPELASRPLSAAFVGYNPALLELTVSGFRVFALCYLFSGINIYASAFFTALCNGLVSAVISFLRSFMLRGGLVLLLPLLFGINGIWFSVVLAEALGAVVSVALLLWGRKKYKY